jgi:glyoxylase-like metal-dependent hydrolase (beta-lactamase superfamily II)
MTSIDCIDLRFAYFDSSIASYVLRHPGGAVLIDPGPESTLKNLEAGLAALGLSAREVTHVLLTHIHLDHAGAAGWLAAQGAQVFVHPAGAPHMRDPAKLLASAARLYGDRMDELWGPFRPVPAGQLIEVADGAALEAGPLRLTALHTPGHAAHHVAYAFEDAVFSGDAGGVRMDGPRYLRLPFVPPETDLGLWRASLERIRAAGLRRIVLPHFGIYADAREHLALALRMLDETEAWLARVMPEVADPEDLHARLVPWLHEQGRALGVDEAALAAYDQACPTQMAAGGLFRYWHKVRPAKM